MYQGIAEVYDRLSTIRYEEWADCLEKIFQATDHTINSVLDLACGTGSMSLELAKRGYRVTGVDLSAEMLTVAETKLRDFKVNLLQADMRELPELGRFDAVICLSDSLNYLASNDELGQVFSRLRQMGTGVFVFDLNTPYYLREVLGNNVFHHLEEDLAYIWECGFYPEDDTCEMDLAFFVKSENGMYQRFDELHTQRAFRLAEVHRLLADEGWNAKIFGGYDRSTVREDTERWLFVATPGKNT